MSQITTAATSGEPASVIDAPLGSTTDVASPIIFFDGVCGLCNESIDRILRWDRRATFQFAPLQGETARRLLPRADTLQLSSIVLLVGGRTYRKSSAVVRILWGLGVGGRIAGALLWLVPWPFRELGYFLVARNRYRWFGKKETCRMPTPEERARFLP
jgi:predicted DCC family thiol-disulfide oxidoreductase YuxK